MKKRVTLQELAEYFGVSRPTMYSWLRDYTRVYKEKYDPKDITSVLDFFSYLRKVHG
jgi:predicted DNA binding protein